MLKNDLLSTIPIDVATDELITKLLPVDVNHAMRVSRSWNSLFGHDNQLAWKKLIERDFSIPLTTLNLFEQLAKIALDRVEVSWYESNDTILTKPSLYSFKDIYQKLRRILDVLCKFNKRIQLLYCEPSYYFHPENHLSMLALCTGNADIISQFITQKERKLFLDIRECFDCPHVYSYFEERSISSPSFLVDAGLFNLFRYCLTPGHRYSTKLSLYSISVIKSILSKVDEHCIQLIKRNFGYEEIFHYFFNCDRVTEDHLITLAQIDLNLARQLYQKYQKYDLKYDLKNPITTEMLALVHKMDDVSFIKKHIQYHYQYSPYFGKSRAPSDYSGITWDILNDIITKNLYELFEFLLDEKNQIYIACLSSVKGRKKLLTSAASHSNVSFLNYLLANRKRLNLTPDSDTLLCAIHPKHFFMHFCNLLDPELGIQPTMEHLHAAISVNEEPMIKMLVEKFNLMPSQPMLDMACKPRTLPHNNVLMMPFTDIIRYLLKLNPELKMPKSCFFEAGRHFEYGGYELTLLHFISSFTFTQDEVEMLVRKNKFILAGYILQNQPVSPTDEMLRLALEHENIDFAQFLLNIKHEFIVTIVKCDYLFSKSVAFNNFKTAKFLLNPQFKQKPTLDDFVQLVNRNEISLAEQLINDKLLPAHACLRHLFDNWKRHEAPARFISKVLAGLTSKVFEFIVRLVIQSNCLPDKKVVVNILQSKRDLYIVKLLLDPILYIQLEFEDISFSYHWIHYDIQTLLINADIRIKDCLVYLKKTHFEIASERFARSHKYSPMQCLRIAYFALSNPQSYQLNETHLSSLIDFIIDAGSKYVYTIPEYLQAKQYLVKATEHLRENRMFSLADRLDAITFYNERSVPALRTIKSPQ